MLNLLTFCTAFAVLDFLAITPRLIKDGELYDDFKKRASKGVFRVQIIMILTTIIGWLHAIGWIIYLIIKTYL